MAPRGAASRPRFKGFRRFKGFKGLWWRPSGAIIMAASRPKTFTAGLRPMANHTTAPIGQSIKRKALLWAGYGPTSTDLHILCRMCTARGNAPLLSPKATSPPEGEILAALYLELLMRSKAERRANFPLRGKWCAAPKGVHFHGRSPVVWFAAVIAININ